MILTFHPNDCHLMTIDSSGNIGTTYDEWQEILKLSETHPAVKIALEKLERVRTNIKEAALNRLKIECPYCKTVGQPSNMKRWHFDNCKEK